MQRSHYAQYRTRKMWTILVAMIATTIKTMAPTRSTHGARLKNSHHTRTTNTQASPPIIATIAVSRTTKGTSQSKHSATTATTPGHTRSGF